MARTSIKHIAEKLNVSNATVSLVLSGKGKNGRISEELAERIKQTAVEMNYRPNMAARGLRTGKSKTIGLIVADISNPFFAKLARYIENAADEMNYQVMFGSSDESSLKFSKITNLFIEKAVDGIIITPPEGSEDFIMQIESYGIPLVMVDRSIESVNVSSIQINNMEAAYKLTNHLIQKGCRRIGFMSYNMKLSNIKARFEGYRKALTDAGLPFDKQLARAVGFE
jgi:LacI family transcriptional regulator